jgi:transposase
MLEDSGIKLSAVATDLVGVSGRLMLEALIAGNTDPAAMADLARYRLWAKIPQLTEALAGKFTAHHAFLTRMHLGLIDWHAQVIDQLTERIEVVLPSQNTRTRSRSARTSMRRPITAGCTE